MRASVADESRALLSQAGRWLQVTIRFLEIEEEAALARETERREGRNGEGRRERSLDSVRSSAGYQVAIRALIAFECNVAENFI